MLCWPGHGRRNHPFEFHVVGRLQSALCFLWSFRIASGKLNGKCIEGHCRVQPQGRLRLSPQIQRHLGSSFLHFFTSQLHEAQGKAPVTWHCTGKDSAHLLDLPPTETELPNLVNWWRGTIKNACCCLEDSGRRWLSRSSMAGTWARFTFTSALPLGSLKLRVLLLGRAYMAHYAYDPYFCLLNQTL